MFSDLHKRDIREREPNIKGSKAQNPENRIEGKIESQISEKTLCFHIHGKRKRERERGFEEKRGGKKMSHVWES